MTASTPLQIQILAPVEELIKKMTANFVDSHFDARLQILEAVAAKFGKFPISSYFNRFEVEPFFNYPWLDEVANQLFSGISRLPINPALALSTLASEPIPIIKKRKNGVYYTDFRLAQYLAKLSKSSINRNTKVLDPASGTGILLAAIALVACDSPKKNTYANWLAHNTFASDVSIFALRGARLALASLTDDLDAIGQMWSHWKVHDSLMVGSNAWHDLSSSGFDLVVGNPPWEKLKLTRHEFLQSIGEERHYGDDYLPNSLDGFHQERMAISDYAQQLFSKYKFVGSNEVDVYMTFVELFAQLLRPGGRAAVLVPAGLIRSQGTEELRRFLFSQSHELEITIMQNQSRFFAIDSRFKFVALSFRKSKERDSAEMSIKLHHAKGAIDKVEITSSVSISRRDLEIVRPDLTIPEVRDYREWDLFLSMCENGVLWEDYSSNEGSEIARELDMSKEREHFLRKKTKTSLPVVEGRMIQIHRFGAKAYMSGTGRRSRWAPLKLGYANIKPQYWIEKSLLNLKTTNRTENFRAGFCDIAGQTNERSMMAAQIHPGVVCGNKVPTVIFPNDPAHTRLYLWLGIVNSFAFDWFLRRILTTTVNYFLLKSIPLPVIDVHSIQGRRIIKLVQQIQTRDMSQTSINLWQRAEMHSEVDILVLNAYRLGFEELKIILDDFPLLDRGQPPIPGEPKSTITKDYLFMKASKFYKLNMGICEDRVSAAKNAGAIPYIISENAHVEV